MLPFWKFETGAGVICDINGDISFLVGGGGEVFQNEQLAQNLCKWQKWAINIIFFNMQELGFPGVEIGSHINEWNLDAPELEPVFAVSN